MNKDTNKIFWIIVFNTLIVVLEIGFGLISNSYALIADALHNAGDVLAVVVTYIAIRFASIKPSFKYTFGFLKAEMMAGFVNMMFLMITMLYMIYEAIGRFFTPEIIEPIYMIVVGIIAVIANGISAYLLNTIGVSSCAGHSHEHGHHHHHHEDINIKSAYMHMLSDALISVGVVIAGIFIYYFKVYHIDSILTILFSLYIIKHSYPLLKKSFLSLMDANSMDVSKDSLDSMILEDENILEYHDLHISTPSSKSSFISFHIVLKDQNITLEEMQKITQTIKTNLKKVGFSHVLIQCESDEYIQNDIHCTQHI
jgi:cobalt-zinc-cadmium efflux system protein